jgi:hypothetical protein
VRQAVSDIHTCLTQKEAVLSSFDLARLRTVQTWSISPENFTGSKGGGSRATEGTGASCARDLGIGWKVSPSVEIAGGETFELGSIPSPGRITHFWITTHSMNWRTLILRAYWDGAEEPAIEVPLGDFFANGWGRFAQVSSRMIAANPHGGFNSYWPMPFASGARLTLDNLIGHPATVYYQITYETGEDQTGSGYLHAQYRRSNPLPELQTHPILMGVTGRGHYVGTYVAWAVNSPGWWGEGEVKFYLDGDSDFPTIAGTGTEDYFGGAYNFDVPGKGYTEFSTPYLGMPQVLRSDGLYDSQQRFGMYRWHVPDPIYFQEDLRVNIQALGWKSGGRYNPLHDDIASTALFYLDRPTTARPPLPDVDFLAIPGDPTAPR